MHPEIGSINSVKVSDYIARLQAWTIANVGGDPLELIHCAIALDRFGRNLRARAAESVVSPPNQSVIHQSLNKKIQLARTLRQLLPEYVNWVGGEVLVGLSEAIAELDGEIAELTEDQPLEFPEPRLDLSQVFKCPMGHACDRSSCSNTDLCEEVATNG